MQREAHTHSLFLLSPPAKIKIYITYLLINLRLYFILAYTEILFYIKAKDLV